MVVDNMAVVGTIEMILSGQWAFLAINNTNVDYILDSMGYVLLRHPDWGSSIANITIHGNAVSVIINLGNRPLIFTLTDTPTTHHQYLSVLSRVIQVQDKDLVSVIRVLRALASMGDAARGLLVQALHNALNLSY